MRSKILGLLFAPLLLLTGCGDETVTAPQAAPEEVLSAKQEASSYDVVALDGRWTQTTGVNDVGTVVGRKFVDGTDEWQAALWAGGVATILGIPRSTFLAINNQGVTLGLEKNEAYAALNGFVYRDGEVVSISGEHLGDWAISDGEFLTGSLDDDRVLPVDINDSGLVSARAAALRNGQEWYYAFVWQEGSAIVYIRGGQPAGMNNHGEIVGYGTDTFDPVVWTEGSYDEPQIVPGPQDHFPGHEIELKSINDSGQILGMACKRDDGGRLCAGAAYEHRGFVLVGGTVVDLPLPRNAVELHRLKAHNESGLVVGTVRKREGSNTNYVPVVWTVSAADASVQELPRGEHTHALANAINGLDQVAGHGNPWEALLWTPATNDDSGDCTHPSGKCK